MPEGFASHRLGATTTFDELSSSAKLEALGRGRQGAVLVRPHERGVPLVRTTTTYGLAAQPFGALHLRLADRIQEVAGLGDRFDNALFEHYDGTYKTMRSHSDQALDLADGSVIALYSLYARPNAPSRRLVVEAKDASTEAFEVPLEHDSVVVFSLATNRRFRHAIRTRPQAPENEWLGLTFRTSKTFLRFDGEHACFTDGRRLVLADEEQRATFLQLRRRENAETDFVYPELAYTLSPSDLARPESTRA